MNIRISRKWWYFVVAALGLLAMAGVVSTALAQGSLRGSPIGPMGGFSATYTFTYQGRLLDGGQPANGHYDFVVTLWRSQTGGAQLATCEDYTNPLNNHYVEDGIFTFHLQPSGGFRRTFNGEGRWIQVEVRPHDPLDLDPYTTLPRQPITAAPYAFSLRPPTVISGSLTSSAAVLSVTQIYDGPGSDASAIYGYGPDIAIHGVGGPSGSTGVKGFGMLRGVHGESPSEWGIGVYGEGSGLNGTGVHGTGSMRGIHGDSSGGVGVSGVSYSYVGVMAQSASGNLIEAYDTSPSDRRFYVSNGGAVYADGAYHCALGPGIEPGTCVVQQTSADFAEMVPSHGDPEPGDVLVVGSDGMLSRSIEPRQSSVVGVYSTQPGYLGGGQYLDQDGYAPLALVGIVPVKASAESGPIAPGDLLVTSATPGHAMGAGPDPAVGTVIGKALEPLEEGTGVIQMLVMLQ